MQLDQWIALYGAMTQTAVGHLRARWISFTGGLLASSLVVVFLSYLAQRGIGSVARSFGIGASSLGLLIGLTWLVSQCRLQAECDHWERVLRSLEDQFAGAELYRGLHRMMQGEEVCIPSASWVCGEWHSQPARVPRGCRRFPRVLESWIPVVFMLAFAGLLVWYVLN